MCNVLKKKNLNELYHILNSAKDDNKAGYPIEIKSLNNGIALKLYSPSNQVTLFFYPDHPVSEFNVIKNNMRFIYPKRVLKFKRHTVGDLLNLLNNDERMRTCNRFIEMYLIAIMKKHEVFLKSQSS